MCRAAMTQMGPIFGPIFSRENVHKGGTHAYQEDRQEGDQESRNQKESKEVSDFLYLRQTKKGLRSAEAFTIYPKTSYMLSCLPSRTST